MMNFLLPSVILPMAVRLGTSMIPSIIKAFVPESAKAFGAHLKDETREKIRELLVDFQGFADSTDHDTLPGKVDDVLAVAAWTVAECFGLLPAGVSAPA